jgi:hypothetical protein
VAAKKSIRAPKAGQKKRRARENDRAFALELVRRYREREPFVFTGPIDGERWHTIGEEEYQIAVDAELFAEALHAFAVHGTFEHFRGAFLRERESREVRDSRLAWLVMCKTGAGLREITDIRIGEDGKLVFEFRPQDKKSTTQAIAEVVAEEGVTEDIVRNALRAHAPRKPKPRAP